MPHVLSQFLAPEADPRTKPEHEGVSDGSASLTRNAEAEAEAVARKFFDFRRKNPDVRPTTNFHKRMSSGSY